MKLFKDYFKGKKQQEDTKKSESENQAMLAEAFNDIYKNRKRIYKVNFFRGIAFGVGSALGGTMVLAIVVWILSLFVNTPLVGEYFQNAQDSIRQTTERAKDQVTE